MRTPRRLAVLAIALFLVGAAILMPFAAAATLTLGTLLLVAWVVVGLFAIATPDYLSAADAPDEDEPAG